MAETANYALLESCVDNNREGWSTAMYYAAFLLRLTLSLLPFMLICYLTIGQLRRQLSSAELRHWLRVRGTICGIIFVLSFAFGMVVAVQVPERHLEALKSDRIADADLPRIVQQLTGYGQSGYRNSNHPLQAMLFQPMGALAQRALTVGNLRAAQIICVSQLALSASLLALTLWNLSSSLIVTLLGSTFYTLSFAYLFLSIVPESSGLGAPTIIAPFALYSALRGTRFLPVERWLYLACGVLGIGLTVTNVLPACIAWWLRVSDTLPRSRRRLFEQVSFLPCQILLAAAVSVAAVTLYPGPGLWFMPSANSEQGRYAHASMHEIPAYLRPQLVLSACFRRLDRTSYLLPEVQYWPPARRGTGPSQRQ